ncbi:hypothetical protein NC800_13315 [Aquibacillus sp. 3ASR75-286]|nr:hypothetical protein [Terrihalobacillus insolitus]
MFYYYLEFKINSLIQYCSSLMVCIASLWDEVRNCENDSDVALGIAFIEPGAHAIDSAKTRRKKDEA